jgi:ABC-2 type transport system permease protein
VASHALACVGGAVFFVLPAVNVYAVRFGPGYLAGYVVLLTLGLLCAAAAMAATLALTKLLGARRALNVIRIAGFVLIALFIVALRLPEYRHSAAVAGVSAALGRVATGAPMCYVAQAAQGQFLPLAGLLVAGLAATALMLRLLERTFLVGAQQEQSEARARSSRRPHRWTESFFRAAYLKELRLLWRDPLLLARLLPMLANLLPVLLVFRGLGWLTLAPLSCAIAQTLVIALTPLLAGGDEAWDLLRSSPIDELTARRCKLAAALTPPLVLAVLMNAALAIAGHPLAALIAFIVLLPGAVAGGWLLAAKITPSPRRGTVKRKGHENLGVSLLSFALIGLASGGLWALNANHALLGVGLIGANWLASFLIFGLTELAATPEWKFEAMQAARASE